jgi:hypothetical protein
MVMDFFASNGVWEHAYNFGPSPIKVSSHLKWKLKNVLSFFQNLKFKIYLSLIS